MMNFFAMSSLAVLASASMDKCAVKDESGSVVSMLKNCLKDKEVQNTPQVKAIVSMIGEDAFDNINGYGCWCYFAESFGKGKSHPVDETDAFCKALHEGYECIMIDNDEENNTDDAVECIPWEVDYIPAAIGETEDIISQCTERNSDNNNADCSIRSCIVEMQFVTSVFRDLLSGGGMNDAYNHDNGFSVEESCPTTPGPQSEKSCCGHYPFRHPFKTYGGQRQCCVAKTFDISILKCCSNGKVRVNC